MIFSILYERLLSSIIDKIFTLLDCMCNTTGSSIIDKTFTLLDCMCNTTRVCISFVATCFNPGFLWVLWCLSLFCVVLCCVVVFVFCVLCPLSIVLSVFSNVYFKVCRCVSYCTFCYFLKMCIQWLMFNLTVSDWQYFKVVSLLYTI